jgi:hypothetical protein
VVRGLRRKSSVQILKVDTDEEADLASQLQVRRRPAYRAMPSCLCCVSLSVCVCPPAMPAVPAMLVCE